MTYLPLWRPCPYHSHILGLWGLKCQHKNVRGTHFSTYRCLWSLVGLIGPITASLSGSSLYSLGDWQKTIKYPRPDHFVERLVSSQLCHLPSWSLLDSLAKRPALWCFWSWPRLLSNATADSNPWGCCIWVLLLGPVPCGKHGLRGVDIVQMAALLGFLLKN